MQAPELFASFAERSPATTPATSGDALEIADAGQAECDPAAAVSLSGLLSRPHLAEPNRPAVPAAGKRDRTPSESEPDPDAADDEEETSAHSRHALGRLFGNDK